MMGCDDSGTSTGVARQYRLSVIAPSAATTPRSWQDGQPRVRESPLLGVLPAEADRRRVQEALHRLHYDEVPYRRHLRATDPRSHPRLQQQNIGADVAGHLTADQANRLVTPR